MHECVCSYVHYVIPLVQRNLNSINPNKQLFGIYKMKKRYENYGHTCVDDEGVKIFTYNR